MALSQHRASAGQGQQDEGLRGRHERFPEQPVPGLDGTG